MKYSEVTGLSAAELISKVRESQAELFEARMKHSLGQLANPMDLRRLRKDIARMKTAAGLRQENQPKVATKSVKSAPKKAAKKTAPAKRGGK